MQDPLTNELKAMWNLCFYKVGSNSLFHFLAEFEGPFSAVPAPILQPETICTTTCLICTVTYEASLGEEVGRKFFAEQILHADTGTISY